VEEERIALRAKERERLKVLHEVERWHLLQVDAARGETGSPQRKQRAALRSSLFRITYARMY
jgi:hypothetical protein